MQTVSSSEALAKYLPNESPHPSKSTFHRETSDNMLQHLNVPAKHLATYPYFRRLPFLQRKWDPSTKLEYSNLEML